MIIDFLKLNDKDINYLRSFENHKIIFSIKFNKNDWMITFGKYYMNSYNSEAFL